MISLALFEPEIPQNAGTLIRLCACFDIQLHIIEPCGFLWNSKKLHRSVMDYLKICPFKRHLSYLDFKEWVDDQNKRLLLIDVAGNNDCWNFKFKKDDILLMGKESSGVPDNVRSDAYTSISIPQKQGRSLNIAVAASIVIGESIRQTR